MRIAVTGSAGRVGQAVVALARADGHNVVEIDRAVPPESDGRRADVTVHSELARAVEGCTALIHLAAHVRPGARPDHVVHNDNVVGSYNALSVAAAAGLDRVCLASSVNALGGAYSRHPRYDYFPVDERHSTYNEDPYGLSKWMLEAQADSFARRYDQLSIASLRIHGVAPQRPVVRSREPTFDLAARHLWGYVLLPAAARACLLAVTVPLSGHEVFYVAAPDTVLDRPSVELAKRFYPDVELRGPLPGNRGFFDCTKAESLLGWRHPEP